ncbi:GntR family transcriptional regulator [Boseongicola aestuarii]|uniref:HTH-type transcriptional repressor CsiR n=1 Tax=Boseongicola aestuarii TaxID=1470561 RepID=A0A238IZR0_9RHOB|nr:GntR family transcriptional regulator [Boseongicola aestuarii]SMX23968.1 HTH-type transcriptional repressor CsiR [Boseongicola aestuarii]
MNQPDRTEAFSPDGTLVTADKRVVVSLRQMILDGSLEPDSKISEVLISKMFDVSRTPARLALRALEVEGLIRKRDGRGYTVLAFNSEDLAKAYEVRGVLEGLAAGTLARTGIDEESARTLNEGIAEIDAILQSARTAAEIIQRYQDINVVFHGRIMQGCGNDFVGLAVTRLEYLPLLRLGTVVFNEAKTFEELNRLRFGNMQHRLILDAIERQDPYRAETLMREHANQIPVYTSLFV